MQMTLLECSLVSTAAAGSIPLPRMTHPEPCAAALTSIDCYYPALNAICLLPSPVLESCKTSANQIPELKTRKGRLCLASHQPELLQDEACLLLSLMMITMMMMMMMMLTMRRQQLLVSKLNYTACMQSLIRVTVKTMFELVLSFSPLLLLSLAFYLANLVMIKRMVCCSHCMLLWQSLWNAYYTHSWCTYV